MMVLVILDDILIQKLFLSYQSLLKKLKYIPLLDKNLLKKFLKIDLI